MLEFLEYISYQFGIHDEQQFIITMILTAITVAVLMIFFPSFNEYFKKIISSRKEYIKEEKIKYDSFNQMLSTFGYGYDMNQDIVYSIKNAWQREMGYCRLYDEAAAPLSMIIDCEPIYFEYDDKRWLIEFWKGQYGMTTGCELGVYETDEPDIDTDIFKGTFYNCAADSDMLKLSFVLKKNGKTLFSRKDIHWWLTGFKVGEFSEPKELSAIIYITLKNRHMRNEFVNGLLNAGYSIDELNIFGNSVRFKFDKPRTQQPYTRNVVTDKIFQKNNKELCDKFQYITGNYDNLLSKVQVLEEMQPDMLNKLFMMGKSELVFKEFGNIRNFIDQ